MNKKTIFLGSVLILFLLAAFWVIEMAQKSQSDLPKLYALPDFRFSDQNGQPFGLDEMKGKINVVDFIFTSCQGPCPMMSSRMARFYQRFAGSRQVQFVSISVDPGRDSLQALRRYAKKYGVTDGRWVFLRGDMEQVIDLYGNGFKLGGMLPAEHSTRFVLVDADGIIRGYYDSNDDISMNRLNTHLAQLAKRLHDR
ncbi:MAG TPA: SCO family protein [Caldithrix abyssi]|uniref:SCO family protein n=1 Tax=Caldithrix abyssi TaxID=187145 RepID=A0A7V4TZ85_CALAY|nr:SCO family protein [Caldithrix abyssi]